MVAVKTSKETTGEGADEMLREGSFHSVVSVLHYPCATWQLVLFFRVATILILTYTFYL